MELQHLDDFTFLTLRLSSLLDTNLTLSSSSIGTSAGKGEKRAWLESYGAKTQF